MQCNIFLIFGVTLIFVYKLCISSIILNLNPTYKVSETNLFDVPKKSSVDDNKNIPDLNTLPFLLKSSSTSFILSRKKFKKKNLIILSGGVKNKFIEKYILPKYTGLGDDVIFINKLKSNKTHIILEPIF